MLEILLLVITPVVVLYLTRKAGQLYALPRTWGGTVILATLAGVLSGMVIIQIGRFFATDPQGEMRLFSLLYYGLPLTVIIFLVAVVLERPKS